MPILFVLLMTAATSGYAAQYYQCTGANGHKTFQQMPCSSSGHQEIKSSAHGNFINNPNNSMAAYQQLKKGNDRRQIDRDIRKAQQKIDSIEQQRQQHLIKLREQKNKASNNLAGATWEQSISAEMQSINQAYDSMLRTERDYLQQLYKRQNSM